MEKRTIVIIFLVLLAALYFSMEAFYTPFVNKAERYDELRAEYDRKFFHEDDYYYEYEDLKTSYNCLISDIMTISRDYEFVSPSDYLDPSNDEDAGWILLAEYHQRISDCLPHFID